MTDKNMADVADKAVDKLSGGIDAVACAVEKVAPHVWEVLVRQARTEGTVDFLIGIGLLAFTVWFLRWAWPRLPEGKNYDAPPRELAIICVVAFAGTTGGTALGCLRGGALQLMNPEYYAAKDLIGAAR